MSYEYERERPKLFTEEGQRDFLKIRDNVARLLEQAGAFQAGKVFITGDTWFMLACLDRLKELGEIREVSPPGTWGQCRTFVRTLSNG